jgi:HEAT repeat protein
VGGAAVTCRLYPATRIAKLRFLEIDCACRVTLASKVTLLARNRVMGGVRRQVAVNNEFVLNRKGVRNMPFFGPPNVEKLKAKGNVKGLIKALSYKKDRTVRQSAAEALGEIGDVRAAEPLLAAFNDDESIRGSAIKALGQIGGTRVVNLLVAAQGAKDAETKKASLEALRQLGPAGVDAVLVIFQNTEEETVSRVMAAQALGQLGDPRAFDPLLATLSDKDANEALREASAKALGHLGDLRAVEPLIATFDETDPDDYEWPLQTEAAQALGRLGDPRAVDAILKALKDYAIDYWEFQHPMVQVLEQLGDKRAIGSLIDLFDEEFFCAQDTAIEVLKTLTGQDIGEDPEHWKQWWEAQK